jgi:pteridine reductase
MNEAAVVLVTGAARRVGAAIVRRLHADGWRVAIHCGHSREAAEALAQQLCELRPASARVFSADLRREQAPAELIDAVILQMGPPSALVNNASTYYATPLASLTPAMIDELVATNLKAPLLLIQAALAAGALHKVVNLLDAHTRQQPRPGLSAYNAAKDGLWALTETLAVELAPAVRVNGVALGHIAAEVHAEPTDAERQDLIDKDAQLPRIPLRRFGTPAEVAAVVSWLLSEQASYLAGAVIPVDGARRLV